ncbi:MAG: hypothetical protein AAF721_18010 [Myxococcota bacterium]
MPRVDLRAAAYIGVGAALFALFLLGLGARLEPPTIAMIIAAGGLALLLHTLYRMVMALARPTSAAVVAHEAGLVGVGNRELREEKRRVLRAINELQFDFEMGKLSEQDYRSVREVYELRAIEVMRQLDGDKGVHPRVEEDLAEYDRASKGSPA